MNRMIETMMTTCVACQCDWPCETSETEDGHGPMLSLADMVWVICDRCRGDGTLGGYPGTYTQADFAEDPDFRVDYMNYRRECEDCHGAGKVRELTEEARRRPEINAWFEDYYETEAIYAAERRMGA